MALVRKPGGEGDFGQRKLCLAKHPFHSFEPPAQKVTVRRFSDRLVERSCKMMCREPGHGSQILEADLLVQMGFNVLADPLRKSRRQPSAAQFWRLGNRYMPECIDARPAVNNGFGPTPHQAGFAQWGRDQCGPPSSVATGSHKTRGNVLLASLAKDRTIIFKHVRQGNAVGNALVGKGKNIACDSIGSNDALVIVGRCPHLQNCLSGDPGTIRR